MVVMVAAMDSIAGISNHQSDTALTNQAITQDSLSLSLSLSNESNQSINQSLFRRGTQPIENHHQEEEARV